jgi:RsmE family RNA methyltransferase
MNICLFEKNELEGPRPFLSFEDKRCSHILNVLHKQAGDTFTAGQIEGPSGIAKITGIDKSEKKLYFVFTADGNGKPLNPLKMIVGFPRPIQLRRLLRDVAALGVCQLYLTGTELGEKSYMQSELARPEKVRELLLEGSVQAGSTHVPEVFIHKSLKETLGALSLTCSDFAGGKDPQNLICLDNVTPKCALGDLEFSKDLPVVAAIGSERGWTDKERELLEQAGFIRCGMGARIMRTETAATVAASIILNSMGVLK